MRSAAKLPAAAPAVAAGRAGRRRVAVAAVNRAIATWLERHAGFLATVRTGRAEHFALGTGIAAVTTARATAIRAAPRFVREALRCVEFLLARGERKARPAIAAGQGPVGVRHSTTSVGDLGSSVNRVPASTEPNNDRTRKPGPTVPHGRRMASRPARAAPVSPPKVAVVFRRSLVVMCPSVMLK